MEITKEEKAMLKHAKAIREHCQKHKDCEQCVFNKAKGIGSYWDYSCILMETEPHEWDIEFIENKEE